MFLEPVLETPELLPKIESMIEKYNMSWLGVEDSSFGLGIIQMKKIRTTYES